MYRHELLQIVMAPLGDQQLVYLTPGGGFTFIFQVSIYAGLILAAPVLVYQLHKFIRPALPSKVGVSVTRMTLLATALISAGCAYGYFVAVPAALKFLNVFAEGIIAPNLTADSYLSFFFAYIGGLALLSLIPLILMFWHWINPMTPGGLLKSEQWILVLAFVLAAIITPTPDAFNQLMIAGPIIAIYQIGVGYVLVNLMQARRREVPVAHPAQVPATLEARTSETEAVNSPVVAPVPQQKPVQRRSLDGLRAPVRTTLPVIVQPRPQPVQTRISPRLSLDGVIRR